MDDVGTCVFIFSYNRSVNIIQSIARHARRRKRESTLYAYFSLPLFENSVTKNKHVYSRILLLYHYPYYYAYTIVIAKNEHVYSRVLLLYYCLYCVYTIVILA